MWYKSSPSSWEHEQVWTRKCELAEIDFSEKPSVVRQEKKSCETRFGQVLTLAAVKKVLKKMKQVLLRKEMLKYEFINLKCCWKKLWCSYMTGMDIQSSKSANFSTNSRLMTIDKKQMTKNVQQQMGMVDEPLQNLVLFFSPKVVTTTLPSLKYFHCHQIRAWFTRTKL